MADAWSDHNCQSWFCITGHWIAKEAASGSLQLKAALIAFHRLCGTHDGKNMAETALQLLDRADVTANVCAFDVVSWPSNHCKLMTKPQVGWWTLDNTANNGTFAQELGRLLRQRDIEFDHLDRQIMCFTHIINICCQHILAKFTNVNLV